MARRSSYITNDITSCLTSMRDNITLTHLQNTDFNPMETVLSLLKPMRAGVGRLKSDLPKDMSHRINLSYDNSFVVVVPLPNRISAIGGGYARTMEGKYGFVKWGDYRDSIYCVGQMPDQSKVCMRGLSFDFNFKRRIVPTSWWHAREYGGLVDAPDEGIICGPQRMGECWDTVAPQLEKLHDLIVLAEYCYEFGRVAARHCTTPGNTKKVWPEAGNFLQSSMRGREIEKAKATGWPVDIRRRMSNLKAPKEDDLEDNGVDTKYLHGQLHRVADMILTSTLMGTPAEYVQQINKTTTPDYHLEGVNFTAVDVYADYAWEHEPSLRKG